jgi:hypothetical protein
VSKTKNGRMILLTNTLSKGVKWEIELNIFSRELSGSSFMRKIVTKSEIKTLQVKQSSPIEQRDYR